MRAILQTFVIVILMSITSVYSQSKPENDLKPMILDVTVADAYGRYVQGLKVENFKLFDNGEPKQISAFRENGESASIGIMIDVSMSIPYTRADLIAQAFRSFMSDGRTDNEYFALTFAKSVNVTQLTKDKKAISDELGRMTTTQRERETKLLDALQIGLETLQNAKNRKRVLIILSDGMENGSKIKFEQAKWLIREANIQLFLVSTEGPKEKKGEQFDSGFSRVFIEFEGFVRDSGGSVFFVDSIADLQEALDRIDSDLRNQYSLEFMPSKLGGKETQKWRKLKVKIDTTTNKNLKNPVATPRRAGYYPTVR